MRQFRYVVSRAGVVLGVVSAGSRVDAVRLASARWPGDEAPHATSWSKSTKAARDAATAAEAAPDPIPDGVP